MTKSIFKASFEESLNLEDDGFVKLQQEQHDRTAKFFKNGYASLWFRIRSLILSLIFPVGFNFFLLIVSMEFHESKTLTLPIAKHESLKVNVFLILVFLYCDWKVGETSLPVTISLSVSCVYVYGLVLIGNGSSCF